MFLIVLKGRISMIEEEKISGIYEMVNQMSHEQRDDFIEKVKVINEIEIRNKAISGEIELVVYGLPRCPDCVSCLALFDKLKIRYEFKDMSKDMKNFKEFMKLRDNSKCFNDIKKKGLVGIPCVYISESYQIFDWKKFACQEV